MDKGPTDNKPVSTWLCYSRRIECYHYEKFNPPVTKETNGLPSRTELYRALFV